MNFTLYQVEIAGSTPDGQTAELALVIGVEDGVPVVSEFHVKADRGVDAQKAWRRLDVDALVAVLTGNAKTNNGAPKLARPTEPPVASSPSTSTIRPAKPKANNHRSPDKSVRKFAPPNILDLFTQAGESSSALGKLLGVSTSTAHSWVTSAKRRVAEGKSPTRGVGYANTIAAPRVTVAAQNEMATLPIVDGDEEPQEQPADAAP